MKELQAIQTELKAPKTLFNSFGKYNYRSAETILEAVKPLLAKHNAELTLTDEIVEVGGRIYVKATARISNGSEAVETTAFAREPVEKKGMDDSQITGTASSYARKYALNGLFLIDDTKDADTDEYQNAGKESKPKEQTDETITQATLDKILYELHRTGQSCKKDLSTVSEKWALGFIEVLKAKPTVNADA